MDANKLEEWFWTGPVNDREAVPCTQEQLIDAEKKMGISLPQKYKEVMALQNGGVCNSETFVREDYTAPVPSFHFLEVVVAGWIDLDWDDDVPKGILVLGSDGDDFFGLDYRNSATEPSVVYREDIDCPIEHVADTFEEYIKGMQDGGWF